MLAGPTSRTRASQQRYDDYLKQRGADTPCEFCSFRAGMSPVMHDYGTFLVVTNVYGYNIWDGCRVMEHLMLVPKRHVRSLGDLTNKEKIDYADIVSEYEPKGYSLYCRAPVNITKSVAHQHTHLIKLEKKRVKAQLYLRKPHLLYFK